MASYRTGLTKIGIPETASVSYLGFASRPKSLRTAIRSMDAPASDSWSEVADIFRDDDWTDEVQGVAWDGSNWVFSANANQDKPGHNDKAIYVFNGGATLGDDEWEQMLAYKDVPHQLPGTTEANDHWGQICFFEGSVFVAHFWTNEAAKDTANVIVFTDTNGQLSFDRWIELEKPTSADGTRTDRAEFQAINPWDGMFYTCFGGGTIDEFFIHDPSDGSWTGSSLSLHQPTSLVQGACFSPNGHLYISTNETSGDEGQYQTIWYYAALNGHRFGRIKVLAEADRQELEGVCFGKVSFQDGQKAQIHTVLLENIRLALDNMYFKSFAAGTPGIV